MEARFRDGLAADPDANRPPDLLAAEEAIETLLRQLGGALLQVYVDDATEVAVLGRALCPCGRRMHVHRHSRWPRKTLFGTVTVTDPYVYCRACGSADRPLHSALGTDRETWSLSAVEAAVDLSSDESCGKAVAKLNRLFPDVDMGRTTALRHLHHHGKEARKFIDRKLADASKLAELPWGLRPPGATELEVEFDGGMIPVATLEPIEVAEGEEPKTTPVRGLPKRQKRCRWEEVKAGVVQKPGETDRLYSLRPTGGLDVAFSDLLSLACLKGWTEATEVRGLADGAVHIRPRMEEMFDAGSFKFILDRPHCKEHLSAAGAAMALPDGVSAQDWASTALDKLEKGAADDVVAELTQAWVESGVDVASRNDTLRLEAGYLARNRDAVAYGEYRANGWSTASSEVESAHRHVVQVRLKIAGAWWHPDHVDDILALRMLKANGWWKQYWESQRSDWRARAKRFAETDGR